MNATKGDTPALPKGDYARVNGLAMYYEVHGSGLPLVLLHGGIHTVDLSFGPMLPTIASAHQAIAVELQGHGRTADIDRDLALTHLADDVVALLDQLGIERADFFGFSLGGLTALQLAMRHPARMDRLVLAATHYRPDGYHDEIRIDMYELITDAQLAVIAGTTHADLMRRADLVLPAVLSFLSR